MFGHRLALLIVLTTGSLEAQQVTAERVPTGALQLDGALREEVWARATAASGFVQRDPVEGAPASERTEVRFAYDDDALWIGARMYSADPAAIQAPMTRRDREGVAEQIVISLDTYRDRRTAYSFGVTPTGVRIDYYHAQDFESFRDFGWDPVWEVETVVDAEGWTAELRIPLTQLRFSDVAEQIWGVNLVRRIPAKNEASYWVLVGRNETGWSSRMGQLTGIGQVRPSRGIEALPYVVGSAALTEAADPDDPFVDERSVGVRAGGDLKVQLGSSLTLDATFNPDFGQVEADPAEVNLTAYETFFGERRPFFLENASLFGGRGFFYSRRIGGPPPISPTADHYERVDNTTILGAAKLGGRFASGFSLGALAAVTDEERVRTFDEDTSSFGSALVAPRTGYGVASVQQEFGADASTVSLTATAAHRDLEPGSPLAAAVVETALSAMFDARVRWAGGKYDVALWMGGTHVRGSADALLALQRSSRRYWQRPDAEHTELDATRTSMTGSLVGIGHSKLAGDWLWDVDFVQESPGLEPNDIGQLGSTDDRALVTDLRHRDTEPGTVLREWTVGAFHISEWTFGGERQATVVQTYGNATLANFWRVNANLGLLKGGLSDAQTRGGPLMRMPSLWEASATLQNRAGARAGWSVQTLFGRDRVGGRWLRVNPTLSLRPGATWELTLEPRWNDRVESRQYVTARDGGRAATFGRRYIFAKLERSEITARIRLNYTFTPSLSLETYVEPFASSGRYHSFGELEAARSASLRIYGEGGTSIARAADGSYEVRADGETFTISDRDFNVRSLRSNAVLRWEWRPGSTAYLVWQQDGNTERDPGSVGPADVFDAFRGGADHFLALKVSYWLPVR